MLKALPFDEEILVRYLSNEATPQDQKIIENWTSKNPEAKVYLEKLAGLWEKSSQLRDFQSIDLEDNWSAIQTKIKDRQPLTVHRNKTNFTGWIPKVAAIFILTVGLGYFSYHYFNFQNTEISASSYKTKSVTLPDGTEVWLNKNASISWEKDFGEINRSVKLDGEAFFEVMKNENKPFLVSTQNTITTVLGTSFNVNGTRKSVEVSLFSGKVNFSANQENVILLPGEKTITSSGEIIKSKLTNQNEIAWKTKTLSFNNNTLEEVMKDMSNYYNIEFEFKNPALQQCTITGKFHDLSLDEILQELGFLLNLKFQKGNNTILIEGENCQ